MVQALSTIITLHKKTLRTLFFILGLGYGDNPAEFQTREKLQRNAEIYRWYQAGKASVVLGHAFGLGDRQIRDIIEYERKRRNQVGPNGRKKR